MNRCPSAAARSCRSRSSTSRRNPMCAPWPRTRPTKSCARAAAAARANRRPHQRRRRANARPRQPQRTISTSPPPTRHDQRRRRKPGPSAAEGDAARPQPARRRRRHARRRDAGRPRARRVRERTCAAAGASPMDCPTPGSLGGHAEFDLDRNGDLWRGPAARRQPAQLSPSIRSMRAAVATRRCARCGCASHIRFAKPRTAARTLCRMACTILTAFGSSAIERFGHVRAQRCDAYASPLAHKSQPRSWRRLASAASPRAARARVTVDIDRATSIRCRSRWWISWPRTRAATGRRAISPQVIRANLERSALFRSIAAGRLHRAHPGAGRAAALRRLAHHRRAGAGRRPGDAAAGRARAHRVQALRRVRRAIPDRLHATPPRRTIGGASPTASPIRSTSSSPASAAISTPASCSCPRAARARGGSSG